MTRQCAYVSLSAGTPARITLRAASVDAPAVVSLAKRVSAAICKLQSRSGHEIDDGPRDQRPLRSAAKRRHPAADFDRRRLAAPGQPMSHSPVCRPSRTPVFTRRGVGADRRSSAADGAGGAVEHRHDRDRPTTRTALPPNAHVCSATRSRIVLRAPRGAAAICQIGALPSSTSLHKTVTSTRSGVRQVMRAARESARSRRAAVLIADKRQVVVAGQLDEARVRESGSRHSGLPRRSRQRSPVRCSTSVGTRIVGRMCRTSISAFICVSAIAAAGLAPMRRNDAHHSRNAGSCGDARRPLLDARPVRPSARRSP